MRTSFHAELTVPGDPLALDFVRPFVGEAAQMAGFPAMEVETLLAAVEQAIRAIMQRAFDPGAPGTLRFVSALTPVSWTLAIHERGLPLDAAMAEHATGSGDNGRIDTPAWAHLHQAVDEAHWVHHGPAGSELRLVKHRRQAPLTERLLPESSTREGGEVPQAPAQEYAIRRLRADETIQVAQCIYRAYGYSYPNKDLYYPERIAHLNETGELLSAVAVAETGEVVGHVALERPALGPIAECGQAVVLPAHRGRHLLERMKQVLEDEGRRLGLALIWSEPVTSHVFSQRADEASGARVCGVSFAAEPRSMHANAMRTAPQRGSCMLYIKYLVPPSPAVVYVPPHHRGMLERIYAHLGTAADVRTSGRTEGCSRVAVSLDRIWGIGTVRVLQAGAAASIEIRQALHDLVDTAGVEVVYLDLPLAQPGTADLCVAAESEGFFFAGVAPLFAPDGDVLRLAYLSGAFDPELLQVASPMGQELVAYAARERKRVTSVCGGEMLSS